MRGLSDVQTMYNCQLQSRFLAGRMGESLSALYRGLDHFNALTRTRYIFSYRNKHLVKTFSIQMDFENCIVVNLQQDSFKCFCVEKS